MSAEIIEFTNDSQRDAVATLRKVADQIESDLERNSSRCFVVHVTFSLLVSASPVLSASPWV